MIKAKGLEKNHQEEFIEREEGQNEIAQDTDIKERHKTDFVRTKKMVPQKPREEKSPREGDEMPQWSQDRSQLKLPFLFGS